MLLLLRFFAAAGYFGAVAGDPDTPVLPANAYLVEARAVHVDEGKMHAADFLIEKVYAGDDSLRGRHFTLRDYLEPGVSGVNTPVPQRIKGEVGLWWVGIKPEWVVEQSGNNLFSYHDLNHRLPEIYQPFPVVLDGGPKFSVLTWGRYGNLDVNPYDFGSKTSLQWAEAIAKVYHAGGDDARIALLKHYAGSGNPPLAAWAVDGLSRFLEPDAKKELFTADGKEKGAFERRIRMPQLEKHVRKDVKLVLEDFADDAKLPVYAQTELDRVLTRIDDDWLKSCRRSMMMERWKKVKDPIDRYFIDGQLEHQEAAK